MVLSFLGLLELVGKVIKRYMSINGMLQWPPWKARGPSNNPEEWNLEMWQEMEQDPVMKARLRRMARDDADDVDEEEEDDDDDDSAADAVVDISTTEKKSGWKGQAIKLKQMIPMRA